ncbi:Hypothetical_protein [Hexamita inflata]|uniref:Hypothetical_protein n=1 Tax=Hexamita inflata TaxID=28002 RepID=A0AA86UFQ5_9EUKA|nr:Hypothetical protein HINF_LOCUS37127 [Hexamita inflata]
MNTVVSTTKGKVRLSSSCRCRKGHVVNKTYLLGIFNYYKAGERGQSRQGIRRSQRSHVMLQRQGLEQNWSRIQNVIIKHVLLVNQRYVRLENRKILHLALLTHHEIGLDLRLQIITHKTIPMRIHEVTVTRKGLRIF